MRAPSARVRIALLAAMGAGATSACREPSGGAAPSASAHAGPRVPAAEPAGSRPVASEAGFDLVALRSGAALLYGEKGGGLSALFMDRGGTPRGEKVALPVPPDHALEVAAANRNGRLAVAWLGCAPGGEVASFGSLGDEATRGFSAPVALGPVAFDGGTGGYLALAAAEDDAFVALVRGRDEPCESDPGARCAAFGFHEILASGSEVRGLPLSVPAPCARGLAGFAVVEGRWHYGLCSRADGRPLVTHFMRQLAPFYVEVNRAFAGCTPLGATAVGSDALLVAECPDGRRGLRAGAMGVPARPVDLEHVELGCELGRPVLRAPGEPRFELVLREPRDRLELLLPRRLGQSGRAAWTSSTLLVAAWARGEVAWRRYGCRSSELFAF